MVGRAADGQLGAGCGPVEVSIGPDASSSSQRWTGTTPSGWAGDRCPGATRRTLAEPQSRQRRRGEDARCRHPPCRRSLGTADAPAPQRWSSTRSGIGASTEMLRVSSTDPSQRLGSPGGARASRTAARTRVKVVALQDASNNLPALGGGRGSGWGRRHRDGRHGERRRGALRSRPADSQVGLRNWLHGIRCRVGWDYRHGPARDP